MLAVGLTTSVVVFTPVAEPALPAQAHERGCRPIERVIATDLGDLGGDSGTTATDLNDRGQVVGVSDTPTDDEHAFLWQRGVMTDLTPSLPGYSVAIDVNNRGQVLLRWSRSDVPSEGTILWSRRGETDIDIHDPVALNDRGQVLFGGTLIWEDGMVTGIMPPEELEAIGSVLGEGSHVVGLLWVIPEPGGGHPPPLGAFVWKNGVLTALDLEPYVSVRPVAVDRRGRVLVNASRPGGGRVALLWDDGEHVELGSLAGGGRGETQASDMNERGQVVGWSTTASGDTHAFLWQDGEMTDLDAVPGRESAATAIGPRGHVAGYVVRGDGPLPPRDGFLWWCGVMVGLGASAVQGGLGPVNARGQVIGATSGPTSAPRAALFTPVRRR